MDLVLFHHAVKAVAAEDEDVSLLDGEGPANVDLHLFRDADRALEHVAARVILRLQLRQKSLPHHGRDEGVIVRELADLVAPHEIDARVTDMAEPGAAVADDERGGRRAHALQVGVCLGLMVDARIGARQRVAQGGLDVRAFTAEVLRLDRLTGQPCRGRAAAVATHTIGDDEQPSPGTGLPLLGRRRIDAEVLILGADQSHISTQHGLHHETLVGYGRRLCRGLFAHARKSGDYSAPQ